MPGQDRGRSDREDLGPAATWQQPAGSANYRLSEMRHRRRIETGSRPEIPACPAPQRLGGVLRPVTHRPDCLYRHVGASKSNLCGDLEPHTEPSLRDRLRRTWTPPARRMRGGHVSGEGGDRRPVSSQ